MARFDCKMTLGFHPASGRFVFDDGAAQHFTACTFASHMWHHALVSIDASGTGQLFVDGDAVSLGSMVNGTFTESNTKTFTTTTYANKCPTGTNANGRRRRGLLAVPQSSGGNPAADQSVSDGYPAQDAALDEANGACCTFRVGQACNVVNATGTGAGSTGFDGLLDEVVVWNRALEEADVHNAMFAMPARLPERVISPHAAAQRDLSAGRVLYARFNRPYTEAPGVNGTTVAGRSPHVVDAATRSAGKTWMNGSLASTDGSDPITFVGFPTNAKYAFTGVPWAAPQVGGVVSAYGAEALPLDGGATLNVTGVGFARSPFLKCALVQHDPMGQFARHAEVGDVAKGGSAVAAGTYGTHWSAPPPEAYVVSGVGADGLSPTSQATMTAATVLFAEWADSPRVRADFKPGMDVTWSNADAFTRSGQIPPFAEDKHDPFKKEFNGGAGAGVRRTKDGALSGTPAVIVGYYETLTCQAPAGAFPSDRYGFAVSNDGGVLLSPTLTTTVADFSLALGEGDVVAVPKAVRDAMGTTFTVSAWVLPTKAPSAGTRVKIIDLSFPASAQELGPTGVRMYCTQASPDSCVLEPWKNNNVRDDANVKVTVGEWHHVAIVIVGATTGGAISFYVDGKATAIMDDTFMTTTEAPARLEFGGPSLGGFVGLVDEIKIWSKAIALDDFAKQPAGAMFSRDPGVGIISSGLVGYYRFNRGLVMELNPTSVNHTATLNLGAVLTLTPGPVPWEPALVYAVDGVETAAQAASTKIKSIANGGGAAAIAVTGFNFAPSQWLKCAWGVVASADGVAHAAPSVGQSVGQCASGGEATLGRVDGSGLSVGPYAIGEMPNAALEARATRGGVSQTSQTSLTCTPPATTGVGLYAFGVVNPRMMHTSVPFEVSETALRCDGVDDVLTASASSDVRFRARFGPVFASNAGYTALAWVKPKKTDAKNATASSGTVLSFQSAAPTLTREAEIVYDAVGARFSYYDDNILAASSQTAAPADQWHYVAVSVTASGEGTLVVDGDQPVVFSTRSKPSGGALTVCARLARASSAGMPAAATTAVDHFAGEVDEVRFVNQAVSTTDLEGLAFIDDVTNMPGVTSFNFTFGVESHPPTGFTATGGPRRVASTGPWRPPLVAAVPRGATGRPAGGEQITVVAANLAPSRWLSLDVGVGKPLTPEVHPENGGSVAVLTTPSNPGCTAAKPVVGVSDVARAGAPGFQDAAAFSLSPTVAGLAAGLVAYVPVEAATASAVSGSTGALRHAPAVGDPSAVFLEGNPAADRDGFEGGAAGFDAVRNVAASPALMAAMQTALQEGHTVMAWMRLDVVATQAKMQMLDLSGMSPEAAASRLAIEMPLIGAWNLVSVTGGNVSINGRPPIDIADGLAPGSIAATHYAVVLAALSTTPAGVGGGSAYDYVGAVDQLWVYGRALTPCETDKRFQVTATAVSTVDDPVPLPIPTPTGGLNMTLSLWVYPNRAAPASAPWVIASTTETEGSATLELALAGPTLALALKRPAASCTCAPCVPELTLRASGLGGEGSSGAARVLPKRWSHVAASVGEGVAALYVDGVLAASAAMPTTLPAGDLGAVTLGASFDGAVFSAQLTPGPSAAYRVKAAAQCAPRGLHAGVARLEEGGDVSGRWIDASLDALPAHGPSTEIAGGNATLMTAGMTAYFAMTAKTSCGARKVTPEPAEGPAFGVRLSRDGAQPVEANVTDLHDGSYAVSVLPGNATGLPCGIWTTAVTLGNQSVMTFATTIAPGPASPEHSYIEGGAGVVDGAPFGAVSAVVVQLMDAHGCAAAAADDHRLAATFEGPHAAPTEVAPLGNGRYRVSFLPESPGTYRLAVTLGGFPIKDAARCVTVSAGAGAAFSSSSGGLGAKLSPPPSTPDAFELTSEDGLAVEAWVKPSSMPTQKASVVYKGGPARAGDHIKGYLIEYDANYVVTASVYVGRSEVRGATASAKSKGYDVGEWLHVGLIYDGANVTLTFDGVVAATSTHAGAISKKPAQNPYPSDDDVTIGFGVDGVVDEVRLWDGGAGPLPTPASFAARMYCPPFKLSGLPGLAAYVPFSETTGSVSPAFSAACAPAAVLAKDNNATTLAAAACGVVANVTRVAATSADRLASTPLGSARPATRGSGVPAAVHSTGELATSHVAGTIAELRWTAAVKDECAYDYIGAAADVVALEATSFTTRFIDDARPNTLPTTEMPVTVQGATLSPPDALAVPGACAGDPSAPAGSNEYLGTLDQVNAAGTYVARILINGAPIPVTYPLTVLSGVPKEFSVIGPKTVEVTAGVTAWTRLRLLDSYGNPLTTRADVAAVFRPAPKEVPWKSVAYAVGPTGSSFDAAAGIYTVSFILPEGPAVEKTAQTVLWGGTFTLPGVVAQEVTYVVSAPRWREVTAAVPEAFAGVPLKGPGARFEHAAVVVNRGNDLVIFGGAAADKTYLADAWRLPSVHLDTFAYRKRVKLVSTGGTGGYTVPAGGAVVEVVVDTAELIRANRMGHACLDVMFAPPGELSPAGSLPFYLDPYPGCNSTATAYLVRLPAGPLTPIDMYYGDPNFGVVEKNEKNAPELVFDFYDGFESGAPGDAPSAAKWNASCAAAAGFRLSSELAYAGEGALYAPASARGALSGVSKKNATMPQSYRLRAWFWDSGAAAASHVLSPGYAGACPAGGGPPGLPGAGAIAVGAYTRCHRADYCVASPWVSSTAAPRAARWHRLDVESRAAPQFPGSSQGSRVSVDGVPLKVGLPVALDAPLIAAGVGVVGGGGHAFWDEVSVLALSPIFAQVSAMSGDVLVAANARAWTKVQLEGPPPPPRYGHTLVVVPTDDADDIDVVVAYGGERSSFVLGEVWTLTLDRKENATQPGEWTYTAPPAGEPQPAPRYDHAAVMHGGKMIVLGGRAAGGAPLGDIWAWDPKRARWTSQPELSLSPPRFGHAAAALGDHVWVFGGYTGTAGTPFTRQLLRCTPGVACVDAALTCPTGFAYDPPPSLTPRYLSSLHADAEFLYVYGGSNVDAPDGFDQVFKFEPASCAWRELSSVGPKQGRYEHASAVAGGRLIVTGGHAAGVPQPEVYMFPLHE